jgi:K+-transporting ATPase A subunit
MDWRGWAEIVFTIALTVAMGWPLGIYMGRVWAGEKTPFDLVLKPVEAGFYAALGIDRNKGQNWLAYAGAVLAFSAAGFVLLYLQLRFQNLLPLNPQGFDGLSPHLAFNTAVSFVTNTNWQSYGGETTVSSLSQMAGLTVHNFVSAGTGLAIAAAVARAFAANRGESLGNFWVDLTRVTLYVLLPVSIVTALALVAAGVPQSLLANVTAKTLEGADQIIALFPVASQEAIKQWGTNGGGLFNVNSAHPFENPTPLTNLIEVTSLNALAFGTVIAFGYVVERFGQFNARLVHAARRARPDAADAAGRVVFGGVGSGFYGMLSFVVLTVFVAGLMVGRTPEYLGKKIEAREMKIAVLAIPGPAARHAGFSAARGRPADLAVGSSGQGPARPLGNPLRLFVGGGEQRLGLRGLRPRTCPGT